MAMGPVSEYVAQYVRRKVEQHSVLVWYDPAGAFTELIEQLNLPPSTRIARFEGSFFRLRAEVEGHFDRLSRGDGPAMAPLLVYVPTQRLPREIDPLLGLAAAGTMLDEDLSTLARQALRDRFSQSDLDELLSSPNLSLAELDRIAAEGGTGGAAGVISLVFGAASTHEVLARYLADPELEQAVAEKEALPALASLAERTLGLPREPLADQTQFKRRLARHLLLTELTAIVPQAAAIPALSGRSQPGSAEQVESCRKTADFMRQRVDMQAAYVRLAQQVEQEFNLGHASLPVDLVSDSDTFPFADDLCLRALEELVQQGDLAGALELVDTRLQRFWAKIDKRRQVQWEIARTALELIAESQRVAAEVRGRSFTPGTMAGAYANREHGWHRIDGLQRTLESRLADMEEEFQLDGLLARSREVYQSTAELLADRFLAAIEGHGFQFGSIMQQTNVFRRFVEPHLSGGPVAYVLVDALRYEMGVHLLERLDGALEPEVTPAIAAVPTITVVGMAALMPGAEHGTAVVSAGDGRVALQVGQEILANAADRGKLLNKATGGTVLDITLDDLLQAKKYEKPAQFRKEIAGKRLVVLRATEIDAGGESDLVMLARRGMTRVLADLKKAIHRLAAAGVERFVVVADHGYLFGESLHDSMKIDPPDGGETISLHRRCWIGRGGASRKPFVRFRASELGMGGDLEFAFPRGLGAFKVKGGGSAYYHGGLSLQELVVPVITFRMQAPQAQAPEDIFMINLSAPRVTNRFFVVTAVYGGNLFSRPTRRVRLEITVAGAPVGQTATAQYGYDASSQEITLEKAKENAVTLFFSSEQTSGEMQIQMRDAESGAVLAQGGPIPFEFTS